MKRDICWDLGRLYVGKTDPRLYRDLEEALKGVKELNHLASRDLQAPEVLLRILKACEEICEKGLRPVLFAELKYFEDTADLENIELLRKVKNYWEHIRLEIAILEISISQLPRGHLEKLISHPILKPYKRYLSQCLNMSHHTLTLDRERLISQKSLCGREALLGIYNDSIGAIAVDVKFGSKLKTLSVPQVISLLSNGEREEAHHAYFSLLKNFGNQGAIWARILDALVCDDIIEAKIRGYPSPIDRQHMLNGVQPQVILSMLDSVEGFYPIARSYLKWKAQRLGVQYLKFIDIHRPIGTGSSVDRFQAREIILNALGQFNSQLGSIVREIFDTKRVHLEPLPHKKPGAFCGCLAPSHPPFIIMSYNDSMGDLLTLAHEMGHAVHYTLASQQSYLNFMPAPVVSETISTLFELVVVEYLMEKGISALAPRDVLMTWIDSVLKTVFRQNVITRFELALHEIRKDHVLEGKEICRLWQAENLRLYHDIVELVPEFEWGWVHIGHIFERPFYCYSYVFGNLASILIFEKCKNGNFMDKFLRFLASGSSKFPSQLFWEVELEINDESIWERALKYFQDQVGMVTQIDFNRATNSSMKL